MMARRWVEAYFFFHSFFFPPFIIYLFQTLSIVGCLPKLATVGFILFRVYIILRLEKFNAVYIPPDPSRSLLLMGSDHI
jgi:hypothetical protein